MTFSGADVVKILSLNQVAGIGAECAWIKKKYPKSKIISQAITRLDLITGKDFTEDIYFDVIKFEI